MTSSERSGFTLIELLAALALSGFVILGCVLLADQVSDAGVRIREEGGRTARDGNGLRELRRFLLDANVGADSVVRFRGDERQVDLVSRCDTPSGWAEPCPVSLAIDWRGDSSAVTGMAAGGQATDLIHVGGGAEWRYLSSSAVDPAWVRQWASRVGLPAGVALVVGADTLAFRVGAGR